jgi:predicted transcriptional regulator
MSDDAMLDRSELLALTTEIVSAYAGNNTVDTATVPALISSVFGKLSDLAATEPAPEALVPAVPIKRSVTEDHIVCLEDGKKLKMLRRHLMTVYGMTPEAYRAKWGLKADYPMVAPSYSARRRDLAKEIGLGLRPRPSEPLPEPEPTPASAKRRSRKQAVA